MSEAQEHIEYHAAGSVHARGLQIDGVPEGYWEWFRLDGTSMRSGTFTHGEHTDEWITYASDGRCYEATEKTPKSA
jgi:hypothetical protein